MSARVYPHERDNCDSCRSYDADMVVDVLDHDGGPGQRSRWCDRCAGPLLAKLVLQDRTALVSPLDAPPPRVQSAMSEVRRQRSAGQPYSKWTVEFAEEVLRLAQPSGSVFMRALVDLGGTADTAALRQHTGTETLHHMIQTLNSAARSRWIGPFPDDAAQLFVAQPLRNHPRDKKVTGYALPAEHVALWAEALDRLGR